MMFLIDTTDTAQAGNGIFIIQMTNQRIARVCWQSDDAALMNNLGSLLDQSGLRVFRMDLKKLAHTLIGEFKAPYKGAIISDIGT